MSTLSQFRLDGRIAFVSGAAGHLGRAMSTALCEAGAHVILNGRNTGRLAEFAAALKADGHACECATFDMGDLDAVRDFFSVARASRHPRQQCRHHDARALRQRSSPPPSRKPIAPPSPPASRPCAPPAPHCARRVAEAGDAAIVNIASMYGVVAPDSRIYARPEQASPAHYGPAKAALIQLTRHLAAELGPEKIRVNALVPGPFPRAAVRADDPAFADRLGGKTMLGRTGEAGEIAGPLLFLASPASSFVTGTALAVDGGWTAW